MTETKHRRMFTEHQSEPFASSAMEMRISSAKITGGGLLTWDLAATTLTWSEDLYIHFPSIVGRVTIAAGNVAGIAADEALYFTLPYLTGDDVDPAGTWNGGIDLPLNSGHLSHGAAGAENEQIFVLASLAHDH